MTAAGELPGLDVAAATAWVLEQGTGARPPLHMARLGHGQSNLTYGVTDAAGARWVLRRPPLGELLASAHDIAREHRVLRALGSTAVPAPAVAGFTEDPAVTGAPLLLVEHVDGLVVDDLDAAAALPPELRDRIGRSLATTLARVHAVDLAATGLDTLTRSRRPYAARQLRTWRAQWEASRTRDLPVVDELADRLEASAPEQREVTLVHGDFHLLNVIVDPATGDVRAVLDWELCTLGDPLADLGGLLAYWPQADDGTAAPFAVPALPGFPSREALVETYAAAAGRDVADVQFWHALGLWKIAVICEGVRRRALDDPRNASLAGVPPQEVVDGLLDRATRVAAQAGL